MHRARQRNFGDIVCRKRQHSGGIGKSERATRRIVPSRLVTLAIVSVRIKLSIFSAGIETTLGVCQAVETRRAPEGRRNVCVISELTTATTRPWQSNTGAPEAP